MKATTRSAKNMTPEQARREFTQATKSFPPAVAKKLVKSAVGVARQAQARKVRRAQEQARFRDAWNKGAGLER